MGLQSAAGAKIAFFAPRVNSGSPQNLFCGVESKGTKQMDISIAPLEKLE